MPNTQGARDHAVIIGASMAGLASAAAISTEFSRVTILERQSAVSGTATIAPQGRFPHVLLGAGAAALDRLLPGVCEEIFAAGGNRGSGLNGGWWAGGWRLRREHPFIIPLASRALMEAVTRRRVDALPNVETRFDARVTGLERDGGRITGVQLEGGDTLATDLTVDCGGRTSRSAAWIGAAYGGTVREEEVGIDLTYVATSVPWRDGALNGDCWCVSQNMPPEHPRLGVALGIEGQRFNMLLGGYHGDRPPTDPDGYREFAKTLPVPEIGELLDTDDMEAPFEFRFPANRRVRFDRYAGLPDGFLVLGDALSSVNPLYGQGMSVAITQAEALKEIAAGGAGLSRSTRGAQRRMMAIAGTAWEMATGGDFAYPETTGERPPGFKLVSAYVSRAFRAASVDEKVEKVISHMQNLFMKPTALLSPGIIWRVLTARLPG